MCLLELWWIHLLLTQLKGTFTWYVLVIKFYFVKLSYWEWMYYLVLNRFLINQYKVLHVQQNTKFCGMTTIYLKISYKSLLTSYATCLVVVPELCHILLPPTMLILLPIEAGFILRGNFYRVFSYFRYFLLK